MVLFKGNIADQSIVGKRDFFNSHMIWAKQGVYEHKKAKLGSTVGYFTVDVGRVSSQRVDLKVSHGYLFISTCKKWVSSSKWFALTMQDGFSLGLL